MGFMSSMVLLLLCCLANKFVNHLQTVQNNLFYNFRDLQQLDWTITKLIDKKLIYLKKDSTVTGFDFHGFRLTGSFKQGSFSSTLLSEIQTKGNIPTVDLDIEGYSSQYIDLSHRHIIVNTNKSGFARINIKGPSYRKYFQNYLLTCGYREDEVNKTYDNIISKEGFLQTYKTKELVLSSHAFKPDDIRLLISVLFNKPLKEINVKQSRGVTKSTNELNNKVYINGELKLIVHIDLAIIVEMKWPCLYAKSWNNRQRLWPNKELFVNDINVSYLIAKTSRKEKNNPNSTELTYSFEHIEHKIIALMSTNQKTVFYTAKTMFKIWIKPHSETYLTSFLIKNSMFWICEESTPDSELWQFNSDDGFFNALKFLFKRLLNNFRENFVPYYFIPEKNLIKNIPNVVSRKAIDIMEELTSDVIKYTPKETDTLIKGLEFTISKIHQSFDTIERMINFNTLFSNEERPVITVPSAFEDLSAMDYNS